MKPGAFAVVVGRTRDNQAVKMISEIMGISEREARDRCMHLGICVARDISLDEAQNLLSRFKSLGAKARIVKPG
jgi:ribosomal protein L7/L12